jgi:hypothetical protein
VLESQKFFKENKNLALRFPIITNSKLAFFEKEEEINSWEANFSKLAIPFKIEDLIEYTKKQGFENLIAVDATASSKLVKYYPALIEKYCCRYISARLFQNHLEIALLRIQLSVPYYYTLHLCTTHKKDETKRKTEIQCVATYLFPHFLHNIWIIQF